MSKLKPLAKKLNLALKIIASIVLTTVLVVFFISLGDTFYAYYGVCISLYVISYYKFADSSEENSAYISGVKCTAITTLLLVVIRIIIEIIDISSWEYYYVYDYILLPIAKSFIGYTLFCLLILLFRTPIFKKENKLLLYIASISFEIYITHQFILLAVYEYVPYCNSGTLFGGFLNLTVSIVLITINSIILNLMVKIFNGRVKTKGL